MKEAGVPGMLEELRDIILPDHPDVKMERVDPNDYSYSPLTDAARPFTLNNGMVEISLGWNYRLEKRQETYSRLTVLAQPLTGAIVVEGRGAEFIPADTLEKPEGKTILEDAIAAVYKNPPRFSPSVSI